MSELGLIEHINRLFLHPLGLAISRDPSTGHSTQILVADDGVWEYLFDQQHPFDPTAFREKLAEIMRRQSSIVSPTVAGGYIPVGDPSVKARIDAGLITPPKSR